MHLSHKASVAILIHNKKILLLLRDDNPNIPNPNVWQLPGGQAEKDESPLETVRRELKEELSFVPDNLNCLGKTGSEIWIYTFILKDDDVRYIELGNEGQELKFFSLEDIKNLSLTPSLKFYIDTYGKGLEMLIDNGGLEDIGLLGLAR